MELKVLAFGNIVDLFGSKEIKVKDTLSKDDLIKVLCDKYPKLKEMTYVVAINRKISFQNETLDEHSEVAIIPPFSGG
jgi:molybdopterin synthase sulfur carrier subunit